MADAFRAVPRHLFVPAFQRADGTVVDGSDPAVREEWLSAVYSDQSLVTQLRPVPGTELRWPTSSSTRPSLMARMLHPLDVADGHDVLEIGTGTGYHAGLLCHRLGDARVTSVELDAGLVPEAARRLAVLGYRPGLVAGDGAAGAAERAPYDRIISTAAVGLVPGAWICQLRADGVIVTDIRGELDSSLVTLRKVDAGTVEGRFLTIPGHFMWLRPVADDPLRVPGSLDHPIDRDAAVRRTTSLDSSLLDRPELRFLLQHRPPKVEQIWSATRGDTVLLHVTASDGSWAELTVADTTVTEGGPSRLWQFVEQTVDLWERLGRPGPGRFGLTATAGGTAYLWLDDPASGHHWPMT